MSFSYEYTIQFRDTDAAGVVYFANILSICHVAYEASLIRSDIDLKSFVNNSEFAVPILHVSAEFFKPLYCSDRVQIDLVPCQLDNYRFEIKYEIRANDDRSLLLATALTKHVVVDPQIRKRKEIPKIITNWLNRWS